VFGIRHKQARLTHATAMTLMLTILLATLALRLKAACLQESWLIRQNVRNLRAKRIHSPFEIVVTHVAKHNHAAAHPLARTCNLAVTELSHAAISVEYCNEHVSDGIGTEAVAV